ncbi:MAG: hypothetical protein A2638_06650 [Nitrospirae bacterium RIFCSPHIGHO2_01_FULL_66_17]|nr:MAG: hypothetical protein A2638_06650 [Nitrospirae bacterium RIFCSPHIGHO2_01_FULL_66_17]
MRYRTIQFDEVGYSIRSIESDEDRMQAYRLRHLVFRETLKWIPMDPAGLDVDEYDAAATSVGIFEDGVLMGLARFVPPDHRFMLEREFAALIAPEHRVHKTPDAAEISRLTVAPPSWRGDGILAGQLSLLLYKSVYQWSLANGVRYLYLVVERRFCRALVRAGFPCAAIGPGRRLPPAEAESVAAVLDWELFRTQHHLKRREFLAWMSTVQSPPTPPAAAWRPTGMTVPIRTEESGRDFSPSLR